MITEYKCTVTHWTNSEHSATGWRFFAQQSTKPIKVREPLSAWAQPSPWIPDLSWTLIYPEPRAASNQVLLCGSLTTCIVRSLIIFASFWSLQLVNHAYFTQDVNLSIKHLFFISHTTTSVTSAFKEDCLRVSAHESRFWFITLSRVWLEKNCTLSNHVRRQKCS